MEYITWGWYRDDVGNNTIWELYEEYVFCYGDSIGSIQGTYSMEIGYTEIM